MVLLDLNLPVRNGREVLQEMAADPILRQIPFVILTTSESEEHVTQLYPPGLCLYRLTRMVGEIYSLADRLAKSHNKSVRSDPGLLPNGS